MFRRDFVKAVVSGTAAVAASAAAGQAQAAPSKAHTALPENDRDYWAGLFTRIAAPVLANMSAGTLHTHFDLELSPIWDGRDPKVAYLECFGRLISGLAPWLALPDDDTAEGRQRKVFQQQALQSYANSVDAQNPDYLAWEGHGQALVDSAYYTNAFLRAPKSLWDPLDAKTKALVVEKIKSLRRVSPPYTNWLLFAAMNETFLLSIGEDWDPERIDLAIKKINEWYVGDGWVADGTRFHFDYYNAYVIWPMMVEILEVLARLQPAFNNLKPKEEHDLALQRMQAFGGHLERMISPEGTIPPIGRSMTYRTASLQPLGLLALRKALPHPLTEGQVRSALTAVQKRVMSHPGTFTDKGYLKIGFCGHQPEIADVYSNSGSLYLVSESFLPLGLPAGDSYWTAPAEDWTTRRAYGGGAFARDHALES